MSKAEREVIIAQIGMLVQLDDPIANDLAHSLSDLLGTIPRARSNSPARPDLAYRPLQK